MSCGISTNPIFLLIIHRIMKSFIFGENIIIMNDYKLALNVLPDRSNYETEVFIMSRREVDKWKDRHDGFGYRCILL
jgi:hypothetical protein